jgi:hypothetical protein
MHDMTNSICMLYQPQLDCRSSHSPPTMIDDDQQQQRRREFAMVTRRQLSTSGSASRVVEDSIRPWVEEDDEYSCNSSSERSEPQLIDDDSTCARQTSNRCLASRACNDLPAVAADDTRMQSSDSVHRPCHESNNYDSEVRRTKKVNFCWLPHTTPVSLASSATTSNAPYHNYIYVGIPHNPPIVCSEGVSRGNVRSLHRKAWLEVSDTKHRYGKNLRMYYRHWESLYILSEHSKRTAFAEIHGTFFDWLDSRGIHKGQPLPEIPDCPRSILDSDTVTYIDDINESHHYAVRIVATNNGVGRLFLTCSNNSCSTGNNIVRTGSAGWMFVIRDNVMYVAPKVINNGAYTKRFHHSSFFGGRAVQAAGIIVTDETTGHLQQILPHSGHYRPGESDVQRVLYFLHEMGICWTTLAVDVQQFLFIDRNNTTGNTICVNGKCSKICSCSTKKKKVESLHLRSALLVADFLSHKARCLQPHGIFAKIEERRYQSN